MVKDSNDTVSLHNERTNNSNNSKPVEIIYNANLVMYGGKHRESKKCKRTKRNNRIKRTKRTKRTRRN